MSVQALILVSCAQNQKPVEIPVPEIVGEVDLAEEGSFGRSPDNPNTESVRLRE